MPEIKVLEVPKWGLSMQDATVNEWLVAVGEAFAIGQPVCELESSKIMNEMEAPFASTLRMILANPGDTVDVQGPLALCCDEVVSDEELVSFSKALSGSQHGLSDPEQNKQEAELSDYESVASEVAVGDNHQTRYVEKDGEAVPETLRGYCDDGVNVTPRARKFAKKHDINLQQIDGTGRAQRISIADIVSSVQSAGGDLSFVPQTGAHSNQSSATPAAKVLAQKLGIKLSSVAGSGPKGKITKDDVVRFDSESRDKEKSTSFESKSLTGMRRTIAKRLSDSKLSAPHYRVAIDCNLDELLKARKWINKQYDDINVSVNDFIVKASALALLEVPELNVQFDGETIKHYQHVDMAVAVAMPNGLVTPIIAHADTKSLRQISSEIKNLVTKAKAGTLQSHEFQGGTFTVSNLGMFGISQFDAIINPPQAAILAVGASRQTPTVVDGEIVIADIVTFNLSSDHRIIDGALAARFLSVLKTLIENPVALSV